LAGNVCSTVRTRLRNAPSRYFEGANLPFKNLRHHGNDEARLKAYRGSHLVSRTDSSQNSPPFLSHEYLFPAPEACLDTKGRKEASRLSRAMSLTTDMTPSSQPEIPPRSSSKRPLEISLEAEERDLNDSLRVARNRLRPYGSFNTQF
jgi:hypothetical protein